MYANLMIVILNKIVYHKKKLCVHRLKHTSAEDKSICRTKAQSKLLNFKHLDSVGIDTSYCCMYDDAFILNQYGSCKCINLMISKICLFNQHVSKVESIFQSGAMKKMLHMTTYLGFFLLILCSPSGKHKKRFSTVLHCMFKF